MAKGAIEKPHLGVFITFVLCFFCFTVHSEWEISMWRCWMPENRTKVAQSDAGELTELTENEEILIQFNLFTLISVM